MKKKWAQTTKKFQVISHKDKRLLAYQDTLRLVAWEKKGVGRMIWAKPSRINNESISNKNIRY